MSSAPSPEPTGLTPATPTDTPRTAALRALAANAALALTLATLCVTALFFFNRAAAPQPCILPGEGAAEPDYAAIAARITPALLQSNLAALCQAPSRFTGTTGELAAANLIATRLRAYGYDVLEQPVPTTVPLTRHARILDQSGVPIPGIQVAPLLPNWFRTATTPTNGLRGRVFAGENGLAREFRDVPIRDNIALLPLGVPWSTVASMGAAAVLYHDDGTRTRAAHWPHHTDASLNVPRFFVQGPATSLVDRTVSLDCRVDFVATDARNIVAFRDAEGADEAIVVDAFYDAFSYAPDLAPGARQACAPAALLALASELATTTTPRKRALVLLASAAHGQQLAGAREFVRTLGVSDRRDANLRTLRRAARDAQTTLDNAHQAAAVVTDPAYWAATGSVADAAFWAPRPRDLRRRTEELVRAALDDDLMQTVETLSLARVDWIRENQPVRTPTGQPAPSFTHYNLARDAQQLLLAVMATPPGKAKAQWHAVFTERHVAQRAAALALARTADAERRLLIAQSRATLAERLARYRRTLFVSIDLSPAAGRLGIVCGEPDRTSNCMPADQELAVQFQKAGEGLDRATGTNTYVRDSRRLPRVENLVRGDDENALGYLAARTLACFDSSAALWAGHTAFTVATLGDPRTGLGTPFDQLDAMLAPPTNSTPELPIPAPIENLCVATRLLTAMTARWTLGDGRIVPVNFAAETYTIRGQAVTQIGDNLTPDHPMPNAVIRFGPPKFWGYPVTPAPGMGPDIAVTADPDGHFELAGFWGEALSVTYLSPVELDAAIVNPTDGEVTWTLSLPHSGPNAPYAVRNVKIAQFNKSLATPVLFRAKAVEVVPMTDPATLRPYTAFDLVEKRTMAMPARFKTEQAGGAYVCYVPPETRLFFTFKKGALNNPNLTRIRAFALGPPSHDPPTPREPGQEIAGPGYFAADTPRIVNIELDAAQSMAELNGWRLALQQKFNMADEMLVQYHGAAANLQSNALALADAGRVFEARQAAAESVAYSSNIHPVIRGNASDAIWGILFYLLLAMPFAIFLEKLLIGHPDLRFQILYQGLIFLAFFFALRAVHPAYQLVRSSFMILLAFITFALAAMVSSFVVSRFRANVAAIQSRLQRRADVADVSRAGAAMTAFVLGLGHLRKRPVRTGLTAATLILTVFVMLSFTSVSTNVLDVQFAVAKAPYTGLFVRDRALADVAASLAPLRELYGERHVVVPRVWAGNFEIVRNQIIEQAKYAITRPEGRRTRETFANAALGLSPLEPRVTPITNAFLVLNRWFTSEREFACMLPRSLADDLAIQDADVRAGNATVKLAGKDHAVLGIFDPNRLAALQDLDGQSMLPLDVLALLNPARQAAAGAGQDDLAVPEDIPRLPAQNVVITPCESMPGAGRTASIAVALQGLDYPAARDLVTAHLERSAEPAYYGLENIAFYGGKLRTRSMQGILELILPIVIAALTVLNTMRGSVYERRDELFVFNAVGLSPAHVRALFLAEASVYAVVGAVGGYLLAQGVGAALHALGLTAGLSFNYSSLASVLVSLIIMAVVFVSALFPARMAARLAAPAELMTRRRTTAEGDVMEFDLPFTFNRRDRIAIVPYFQDWFADYGEGSSGGFFCSPPACGALAEEHGGAAPFVQSTTWLKPYDLGVSQSVTLVVRHVPATGDNVATAVMQRLSGDRESWERCCHAFIGLLRKRFLTWRAVPDTIRAQLLDRGRQAIATAYRNPPA